MVDKPGKQSKIEHREIIFDIPEPPADLSYADLEDYRNRELLKVNGIPITEEALLFAVNHEKSALRNAAVHTLGELKNRMATPALEKLAGTGDDLVKVEAAYALIRLGNDEQRKTLKECLKYPADIYLSPPVAAGYLARLGDGEGFPVIVKCLGIPNPIMRTLACKQLYFFVPFQRQTVDNGQIIDVFKLFTLALRDESRDIVWLALLQLREIPLPQTKTVLETYAGITTDRQLRDTAQEILKRLPK